MDLFRKNVHDTGNDGSEEGLAHRFTLDLCRADILATMIANSRASRVVEVSDLLAGMYIHNWDRLAKYWEGEDQERIEEVLRKTCHISPARWNFWIQQYDASRRNGEKRNSVPLLAKLRKQPKAEPPPQRSAELEALLKEAGAISPLRDRDGLREVPVLTSECVLLCIVRNRKSEISRKLASSGLDIPELERDALSSRRSRRSTDTD
jgi:hypothetical protein